MPISPTFVLLAEHVPAETLAPHILGRVVADPARPWADYKPQDPTPLIKHKPIEVIAEDAYIYYEYSTRDQASGQLGRLFSVSGQSSATAKTTLTGKRIITRLLVQQHDTFKAILARHQDDITELLRSLKGKPGYMAVGVKTIVDGSVELERALERRREGQLALPLGSGIGAAVSQGTSTALNLGSALDPKVEAEKVVDSHWVARNQFAGEKIFAVQYREVVLEKKQKVYRLFASSGESLELEGLHRPDLADGVLNTGEDEVAQKEKKILYDDSDDGVLNTDEDKLKQKKVLHDDSGGGDDAEDLVLTLAKETGLRAQEVERLGVTLLPEAHSYQ